MQAPIFTRTWFKSQGRCNICHPTGKAETHLLWATGLRKRYAKFTRAPSISIFAILSPFAPSSLGEGLLHVCLGRPDEDDIDKRRMIVRIGLFACGRHRLNGEMPELQSVLID